MEHFISNNLIDALGWTVLHSIWQAMLVALVMAGAMVVLQKYPAKLRYRIANMSLLLVVALAIYTFWSIYAFPSLETMEEGGLLIDATLAETQVISTSNWAFFEDYFNAHLPLIVSVWLVGMVLFLLRMLGGLAYTEYLKNSYTQEMPETWQNSLKSLANKLKVKQKVAVLESALVKVPLVIGWLKPVILIPIGAINGLTTAQVEAVLAHELAHISRQDYLINILQSVIEVLFYFNPAVWWISANIRLERENCCDDMAVAVCGDRLAYAKALVLLEEQQKSRLPIMGMAFSSNKKQLLTRISRILNHPQNKSSIMEKFVISSLLLLSIVVFSSSTNSIKEQELITETEMPAFSKTEMMIADEFSDAIVIDSLPQGKNQLIIDTEEQKMEVKIENGKIKQLKIDGKDIPESEYVAHEAEVEKLWKEMPEVESLDRYQKLKLRKNKRKLKQKKKLRKNRRHKKSKLFLDDDNVQVLESDGNVFVFRTEDGENKPSIWVTPNDEHNFVFDSDMNFDLLSPNIHIWNDSMQNFNLEGLNAEKMAKFEAAMAKKTEALGLFHEKQMLIAEKLAHKNLELAELNDKILIHVNDEMIFPSLPNLPNIFVWEGDDSLKSDKFISHLIADGLLTNGHKYKVEISGKRFKINGKKQSKAIHQKYLKIYESLSGFKVSKKTKIFIEKN